MAGSAVWTTPMDWAAGITVLATHLNPHIRDNETYLKGVLTGLDLQDVTVHANKQLLHGALAVMRGADATKRHVEGGSVGSGALGDHAFATASVTFVKSFSAGPPIGTSISAASAGTVAETSANALAASTTGFSMQFLTQSAAATLTATWIAVGAD